MVRFLEFYYDFISKYISYLESRNLISKSTREKTSMVITLGLQPLGLILVIIMMAPFINEKIRFPIAATLLIYWWTSTIWILIKTIRKR
ncbi:MAG: hypothetical protein R3313_02570 [Candidatus Saccharimonadales bacterium]|nr:hypothetical protein [Candidatus Saccharimonadales bacterium]